jgi:ribonuclease HI
VLVLDPHALKIYIDGSALDNPGGTGGIAAIVEYPQDWNRPNEQIFAFGYVETTNNRMELLACVKAFEYVREQGNSLRVQRVLIVTDSMYIYENHRYAQVWKDNGWKTSAGRPVENQDLWNQFLSLRRKLGVRTEIMWKKGKTSPLLKDVDKAAKGAADQPWEIDRGFRGGKVGKSKLGGRGASTLFSAQGQEAVIHVYRSGLAGKDGYKVFFDLYSEQESQFVAKHRAYTSAELAVDLHRHHLYKVWFNSDPKHPVIEAVIEEVVI